MNLSSDWVAAWATVAAAFAAGFAALAAWLQWRATKEQTRASLFTERYNAYRDMRDQLQRAHLNEGTLRDAQEAQKAADKMRFLFSDTFMTAVDSAVALSYKVAEQRQLSFDGDKRKGNPHYYAMSQAVKELGQKFREIDAMALIELEHRPKTND